MKKQVTNILTSILLTGALTMTTACTKTDSTTTEPTTENTLVSSVVVSTSVTPGGQFPDSLLITLDEAPSDPVLASDFSMTGKASNWMDPSLHEFTASFSDAILEGNSLTLKFDTFKDKYFFVDSWTVTNSKNAALSFSSDKITEVLTPIADNFETFTEEEGESFTYHLYTPEDTSAPLPIVVVFHGYADTNNLLTYRTSVAWAEENAQQARPCYVLSPSISDELYFTAEGRDRIFEALYNRIQTMIQENKVDPSRIYIMGNSFGGMSTIEFTEKYPDLAAGALALCSAVNYSESAEANLEKISSLPIWFVHAEHDSTISSENSKSLYSKLAALGNSDAKLTIYKDDEMNAAGCSSDPDSTFSYHHVEMAVMEDPVYAEWLFAQKR